MVIAELNRQKDLLREKMRKGGAVDEAHIEQILGDLEQVLSSIIQLMKDGKSAHEKFFSDIILNSIDAIIGFDNEYKVFLWNKGAENIFGYSKSEVMGRDFEFLIPEYVLQRGEKDFLIREVVEKGFLANHESERVTKSGKILDVSISRFAVFNEEDNMIGSVGILRDISTIKKLQKELREKENLALIGEVVSSIAHSLSNPLNIISGNADYLLLNKNADQPEYEELKTIVDETTRITRSLRGLLDFSRPLRVEKTEIDINEMIEDITGKAKFTIGNKDIKIKKALEKELPRVKADKNQIEESISNIIINAIQAITGSGEIYVRTRSKSELIIIEISDNGPGIPKENLEKIFLPFYSSKGYGKGTGLGLTIVKRILEEHGGSIKVHSLQGKGTDFTMTLPVN